MERDHKVPNLDHIEEFDDHCCYASKEVRSFGTFHLMTVSFHFDEGAFLLANILCNTRRVHVPHGGHKNCRRRIYDICRSLGP